MARKWFGRRSATTKASATGPTPITAAMTTSRIKPVMRETRVQPPTDRICFNIRSRLHGATIVAKDLRMGGIRRVADPLGDDVERPPLHLGEDAAMVIWQLPPADVQCATSVERCPVPGKAHL